VFNGFSDQNSQPRKSNLIVRFVRPAHIILLLINTTVVLVLVLVLDYAPRHEDVLDTGDIAPRILNLGTRQR
jgi:hypothetical protein